MGKGAYSIAKIEGVDGPTSVFVIKKNAKLTLRQKISKFKYKIKRAYVERTLKAESHSIDEVMEYIVNVHGLIELDNKEVHREYKEMRASFIMQYAPELLGEYTAMPKLKSESQEDIQAHLNELQDRQQRAMEVPTTEFDIEFHKFQLPLDGKNDNIHIIMEKRFAYIGGGACGDKKTMKKFQHIYKDVYRYYGVTSEDIEKKSKRYEDVVRALTC